MPSCGPRTSNTRPVTLAASGLASHVVTTEIQRGDMASFISSVRFSSPPMSGRVSRETAVGARQFTVTPYFTNSWAAMIVKAAMPALAAP